VNGAGDMGRHILVIDDDRLVLAIFSDILTEAGYKVSTAQDVVYCNDLIYCKSPPDLIMMDINMPMMSGDHKARIIKHRPKSSQIPIILISSMEEHELRTLTVNAEADDFLVKPVHAEKLLDTVARFLRD
jgi:DNA-binding response OmpR family regulator